MLCSKPAETPPKKKGGRSPLSVSPSRLISLTARCFFACGLDCAWDERTRPVKEWERANIPPHPVPDQHGHVGRVEQSALVSLRLCPVFVGTEYPGGNSGPYTPPGGAFALATPAGRAAGVAFHAGAVAHQRIVSAFAAGIALIALHLGLGPCIHAGCNCSFRDRRLE